MKHFVIICEWASGCERGTNVVGVEHSLEEAKEVLSRSLADERQYAKEEGLEIYADCDTEFDAGEDGNYTENHVYLYIQTV
jgi:hypothetical protein